jgi:hypothetical protein
MDLAEYYKKQRAQEEEDLRVQQLPTQDAKNRVREAARQGDSIGSDSLVSAGASIIVGLILLALTPEDLGTTAVPGGALTANGFAQVGRIFLGTYTTTTVLKATANAVEHELVKGDEEAEKQKNELAFQQRVKKEQEDWLAQFESDTASSGLCCKITLDNLPKVTIDGRTAAYLGNDTDCAKHGPLDTGVENVLLGAGPKLVPLATIISLTRLQKNNPTDASTSVYPGGSEGKQSFARQAFEVVRDQIQRLNQLSGQGALMTSFPAGGTAMLGRTFLGLGTGVVTNQAVDNLATSAGHWTDGVLGTNGLFEGALHDLSPALTLKGLEKTGNLPFFETPAKNPTCGTCDSTPTRQTLTIGDHTYDITPGVDTGQQIKFGQVNVSPRFSTGGFFNGASVDEIASKLTSGELSSDDVPVQYLWVNAQKMVVNNRSLTALSLAGMEPTNMTDVTGNLPDTGDDALPNVVSRLEEMPGNSPSDTIGIRELHEDWNSPVSKTVSLPKRPDDTGTCPTCDGNSPPKASVVKVKEK